MMGKYMQRLMQCGCKDLLPHGKCMSTFTQNGREEAAVVSEDGKVLVCWHPEPPFPYECTKPIPERVETSHLNLRHDQAKDVFRKKHPYFEIKMLQDLTFTNKHIWYPRKEDKLIKFTEQEPRDREYL